MKLTLSHIVEKSYGRHATDRRRMVHSVIASYTGEDGYEYRKRFVSYSDPVIPKSGTHKELNFLRAVKEVERKGDNK